ncbi:MAG: hypothetical protein NZ898_07620 [Myxococcota bacterium]|nr:hypothetical protein [Myxococcota bacterium]MDW8363031.1 hypothetical protein [Myxococcales bacterium]
MTVLSALIVTSAARARAEGDGAYGRLDADVTLHASLGAGAVLATGESAAVARLGARWVESAGAWTAAEWRPNGGSALLSAGVALRPLFPALFLLDRSTGIDWVDLTVQSVGLELGVVWGPLGAGAGAALQVGASLEAPLVRWKGADGLYLALGVRWRGAHAQDVAAPHGGAREVIAWAALLVRRGIRSGLLRRR